jgi:hypothetical protein
MLKTVGFPSTRTGDQTIVNGNLVIGTAGKGIDFSADPAAAGMTSELFDDYEEGTWTPGISGDGGSAGSVAYTSLGYYTKVGRLVTLNGYVAFSNLGSWTGRVFVTGVPFSANIVQAYGSSLVTNATIANALNLNCSIGAVSLTQLNFPWASSVGGGGDNVRFTNITATTFMTFSITYMTA